MLRAMGSTTNELDQYLVTEYKIMEINEYESGEITFIFRNLSYLVYDIRVFLDNKLFTSIQEIDYIN
jgi:hypothetical protein